MQSSNVNEFLKGVKWILYAPDSSWRIWYKNSIGMEASIAALHNNNP